MSVSRLGIHESTSIDFPFEVLADALDAGDAAVVPVGETVPDCDAYVTFTHQPALLDADPTWVHTTQAGVDGFPLDEYRDRGVALTNSAGLHGDSVGETAVGMMLALARRIHAFARNQASRTWAFPEWDAGFTVRGERVCVVGLGTIGGAVAERADALGMDVVGVRRSGEPAPPAEPVYPPDALTRAVSDARFVVLACPLTDETRRLVDRDVLDAMRGDAFLVNVARGGVVDQDALVEALDAGVIAGAALDVFEEEPLPDESPLWGMEDVLVTPHAAVADVAFHERVAGLVSTNRRRLESGEPLENRVV